MASIMNALRQAIDEDQAAVLEAHPQLGMFLRSQATFVGAFGEYRDPTFVQYAALMNRRASLELFFRVIFDPKPSDPVVEFERVFLPRESNTKANLLVLAVHSPNFETGTLAFLLDFMHRHRELFRHITVDECGPYRPTALFEAVELGHATAVRLLLDADADPMYGGNGLPPPLLALAILREGRSLFDSIFESLRTDVKQAFIKSRWDDQTLEKKEDGIPVSLVLMNRGVDDLGQRMRELEGHKVESAVIRTSSPFELPPESDDDVATTCSFADCFEDEELKECARCHGHFCILHFDDHNCRAIEM
jgi:hypothetical protein